MRNLSLSFLLLLFMSGLLAANEKEVGFVSIFDGKTFNGWKAHDMSYFRIENESIIGESTKEKPLKHNLFLIYQNGKPGDFELRLQFRISGSPSANSGIQFRGSWRDRDKHVLGYQADIDLRGNWLGSLYDEGMPRKSLAKRGDKVTFAEDGKKTVEKLTKSNKELFQGIDLKKWNDYSIYAKGNHIVLKINGETMCEVIDNDKTHFDAAGLLALQIHSGPAMKIEFRNIRIRDLSK